MPETTVPTGTNPATGSIEHKTADVDVVDTAGNALGSGSAISFGEGTYLTVAHNFVGIPGGVGGFNVTLREGLNNPVAEPFVPIGNATNLGNYQVPGATSQSDIGVFTTGGDSPNSSAVVYQNPNDIDGSLVSAGYPGGAAQDASGTPYNAERMIRATGSVDAGDATTHGTFGTNFLQTNADTTRPAPTSTNPSATVSNDDGLGVVPGQSGSGVELSATLQSADTRLADTALDDKLAGVVTYASSDGTTPPGSRFLRSTHDASQFGGGVTPITPSAYNGLAAVAENAAQANEAARDAAAGGPATPLTPQEVADKFDTQTLVADQQGTDGSTSTFNGTAFNEISYMNQNVNVNMDLGPGTDTADYYMLDSGINATVDSASMSITKTYDTTMTINLPPMLGGPVSATIPLPAQDTVANAENLVGTGNDDNFTVNSLESVERIDGRDLPAKPDGTAHAEADSLTLGPNVGPVEWTFDRNTDGTVDPENVTVTDGTHTARFENIENYAPRVGDTVDGVEILPEPQATPDMPEEPSAGPTPLPDAAIPPVDSSLPGAPDPTFIPIPEAVRMLAEDEATLSASPDVAPDSPVREALSSPDAAQMYQNLSEAGIDGVRADITPEMDAEARASELLSAGYDATIEAGIPLPEETRAEEAEFQPAQMETDYDYAL